MKLFTLMKDGGAQSRVWGYFLIEWKRLFSIVLLHFKDGSREAYHTHAFGAVSWLLWGRLEEQTIINEKDDKSAREITVYKPSIIPIITPRDRYHKVVSRKNSWVISFRGPWGDTWKELIPHLHEEVTLTHGRKVVQ